MSNAQHEYLTEPEFRAWHGALQFTNEAMRALDEALRSAHDISITEFDVLITLYNAPERRLRMAELSERVTLTPSGLTHLATRLERKGFVTRVVDPADRRSFFAKLTAAGDRRLRESRTTHNKVVRARLTRRLSAKQLRALGDLWKVIESEPT
jgi:DNA-binding MarR family transcriptional regulator